MYKKKWSRKGKCPVCNVGTGSAHNEKKHNESNKFADWTDKYLKEYALSLDEQIYGEASCYGVSDLRMMSGIMQELERRGIRVGSRLTFN